MEKLTIILQELEQGKISADNAEEQVLRLLGVSGRSELLIAYTKWLRENNHLQSAPFPSLVKQFEAINSH